MKRVRLDSPHGRSATEVLAALSVTVASGLSEHEAKQRLAVYGANAISSRQKVGLISVLVHQFQSLVVALLAVAAAVAFYFREWEEGGAIVGVLILNTAIGFITEIKAVRSIEAIRALGGRSARVLRGGQTHLIPVERLVPGDIVLLDAGDVISADLRVVESADLDADELTLTGESIGVGKSMVPVGADARVADRTSMLFKGTSITRGSGTGGIVAFAQLWHVFNMRHQTSRLILNEISRNPWIWGSLALCLSILLTAAYVPSLSYMLHMVAPDIRMWGIILAMSTAPLLAGPIVRRLVRPYNRNAP